MARITWLADVLRAAGCKVVETPGWKTRGAETFDPVGVTWHATAGSRTSTAQAEVNVLLNGSTSAPPPIAQLMLYRDGTFWVVAAGRCNHNKVGWDGPNKGLGNTNLLGIEMANDNKGEPWPGIQLDAARKGTAAIMKRLGADPLKRLAAHYEHQPYATRPPGEGSTKSDPYGVNMLHERVRVSNLMKGDDVSAEDVLTALRSAEGQELLRRAHRDDVIPGYDPASNQPIPVDPNDPKANTMTRDTALTMTTRASRRGQHLLEFQVLPMLREALGRDPVNEAELAAALLPMLGRDQLVHLLRDRLSESERADLVRALTA